MPRRIANPQGGARWPPHPHVRPVQPKHLSELPLDPQGRARGKEIDVGTIDTTLNTSDLCTKFHPRKRFDELLAMIPVKVMSLAWVADSVTKVGATQTYEKEVGSEISFMIVACLALLTAFVLGACCGALCAAGCQVTLGREEKREKEADTYSEEYFRRKALLLKLTSDQLKGFCTQFDFHCGTGATKEAMARGLLVENMDSIPAEVWRSSEAGLCLAAPRKACAIRRL